MPASHMSTIQVPAALVLIQLPVNAPGKAEKDGQSALGSLPPTWEISMEFHTLGLSLAQLWLL